MTVEKRNLAQLRRTRNILGVVLAVVVLVAGLVTVGFATKLKKDNSDEQPILSPTLNPTNSPTQKPTSSPTPELFRITDLADQEALCEAIKQSDEFDFEDSATEAVYVSCQDEGGRSFFSCVGDGTLSSANDFCFNNGFKVCPCDPGQIIDATNLIGGFGDICVDEIDPNSELCTELGGNLEELINPPTFSPTEGA